MITDRQKEVNDLYYSEGCNVSAVARKLGITRNSAIKALFHGARNGLSVIADTYSEVAPVGWSSYSKSILHKDGEVKLVWDKIKPDEGNVEFLKKEFSDHAREHAPQYTPSIKNISNSGNAIEIDIHDLHFGSLCWGPETGQHYDIKIAQKIYLAAIEHLVSRIIPLEPEAILFPVGSDFFNVNSKLNMTVAGTAQDEDCRWQKTYVYGRRMVVQAVDMLRSIAPVHVPIIGGNHDEERAFYLGDSLSAWYRNCDNVTIDNSPTLRKYWKWGKCLIGLTHGSEEPKGTLPMIMANEVPKLWANTIYREWHIGHLHHASYKSYDYGSETQGVRERILSSLAATDSWHKKKGYSGLREATAFNWNKEHGQNAIFSWHP